jgi:hypothetical protein
VDAREIFDLIRNINDPEHPLSLEQLDVVKIDDVDVNDNGNLVKGWKISKRNSQSYFSQNRKAVLGDLCPKSILDKSQFYVPTGKTSEKIMSLLLCQF